MIKFWPSFAPGKGSAAGRKFLSPPYYQRAVFASLRALFIGSCAKLSHDGSVCGEITNDCPSGDRPRGWGGKRSVPPNSYPMIGYPTPNFVAIRQTLWTSIQTNKRINIFCYALIIQYYDCDIHFNVSSKTESAT